MQEDKERVVDEGLLKIGEVAGMLRVSDRQVWRLIATGELGQPVRLGRRSTRMFRSQVSEYFERLRQQRM